MKFKQPARYSKREDYFLPEQGELGKILIVILVVAVLVFAGFIVYINHLGTQSAIENYIFPSVRHPRIVINDDDGSIFIHSQKHGPYGFNATKFSSNFSLGLSYITVDYIQDKALARINTRAQASSLFPDTQGVDLDLTVPPTTDVEIYTAHGDIKLDGIQGNLVAEVKSGLLSMTNSKGLINLKADAGSVMASNVQGQLNAVANQGNIVLRDVVLKKRSMLQVAGGTIAFQGALERSGHTVLLAQPGPVTLAWPATTAFRLHIGRGSGPLTNEFGHLTNGKGPQADITVSTNGTMINVRKTR